MPLHDYVKHIYEDATDPAYIIRFLDYLIGKRYKRTTFVVNDQVAEPLITGILENTKTKERYYSLAQFYTKVTGQVAKETDISLLGKIHITKEYTVMRIICNMKEDDILGFFDQKYRSFLMYRAVRNRIKQYTSLDINNTITLFWNNTEYKLNYTNIICNDNTTPYGWCDLLKQYEDGFIKGLYYRNDDTQYLITDY